MKHALKRSRTCRKPIQRAEFHDGHGGGVVVAAGRGDRAGGDVPKQYRDIAGEPMIRPTLRAFLGHAQIDVGAAGHPSAATRAFFGPRPPGCKDLPAPVAGGATRQASVRAGLEALAGRAPELVLIHDAARPFLDRRADRPRHRRRQRAGAAVPGIAIADTVKAIDAAAVVTETLDRSRLAHGADAAGLRFRSHPRRASARRGSRPAKISPTMPRSPNGPVIASACSKAKPAM